MAICEGCSGNGCDQKPMIDFWKDISLDRLSEAIHNDTPINTKTCKEIILHLINRLKDQMEITSFWRKDSEMEMHHRQACERRIRDLEIELAKDGYNFDEGETNVTECEKRS